MSDLQQTALVEGALQMTLARRCPETGLLYHSDRGSQYASRAIASKSPHSPLWLMKRRRVSLLRVRRSEQEECGL